mgnify:CR=1 FL=1
MANVPEKPTLEGLEARWGAAWEEAGTYSFDRSAERADSDAWCHAPSVPHQPSAIP